MTVSAGRFPVVLLPGPDTPAAEVTRLVQALPAALRPVVLRPADGVRPRTAAARAPHDLADGLVHRVRDAGVTGLFALHGWGTGAYLGLALAGAFERAAGYAVCTTLFVSDAPAPGRAPARATAPAPGRLTHAVRRTVTESRLVVCADPAPAGPGAPGLAPWSRHSTSGTEFVTLPPGPRATALAGLIAARLLPAATRAARTPAARVPGGDRVAGAAP
ncbi:hypothetical protein [Streptomyces sp. NPDC003877]